MKKLLFAVLTVGLLTSQGIVGQSKRESIQGVWQAVEVTITGPGARTIAIPEPRPNLTIITARHYSRVEVQAEGPRPIPANVTEASADELRAVWGPFVGEAGTYEVTTGNLITMRPIAAKNPAVMGPGARCLLRSAPPWLAPSRAPRTRSSRRGRVAGIGTSPA